MLFKWAVFCSHLHFHCKLLLCHSFSIVRENWIRAKYVRKEFMKGTKQDEHSSSPCIVYMPERVKQGFLMKLNKKNVWQKRYFILLGRFIYYFKKAMVCMVQFIVNKNTQFFLSFCVLVCSFIRSFMH